MRPIHEPTLGAVYLGDGRARFRVWAPRARDVSVRLIAPAERTMPLRARPRGYFEAVLDNVEPGSLYMYQVDSQKERPDPASRCQAQGVHGPSQVVDGQFAWEDERWFGVPLRDYVLYELHVGTFSPEGTFDGIMSQLDVLKELGVTALELMPIAQFPGDRNWGYDGVFLFAPQYSYGGPLGLKRLVNACHARGLAVVLDVVYNHLGPEGNYLWDFGHYFTDRYHTPWGAALNFDGEHSDEVRQFFIENALYWQTEFHIDALRLDAIHAIRDFSARPFLAELKRTTADQAERLNRRFYVMAESNLNDTRVLLPAEAGGLGLDAQWLDDFHHSLHTAITGETGGYYEDFVGLQHLAKAFTEGFVYDGQYSPYRGRRHGNSSLLTPAHCFVVSAQNHDQIGNRMLGERLSQLVSFEGLKLSAAAVVLSPFLPMLFMGEEYGETAPFQFFTSHADAGLIESVRKGRQEEFASFRWQGDVPDPQADATFFRCKLNHALRDKEPHRTLWNLYQELFRLRRTVPALARLSKKHQEVFTLERDHAICLHRWSGADAAYIILHFGESPAQLTVPVPPGRWQRTVDTADQRWGGPGSSAPERLESPGSVTLPAGARSCLLFRREAE